MSQMVSMTDYFRGVSDAPELVFPDRAETRHRRQPPTVTRTRDVDRSMSASAVAEHRLMTERWIVELSTFAAEVICRENLGDGYETGGPLLGVPTPEGVRLVDAAGPGSDPQRGPSSIRLDLDRFESFERSSLAAGFEGLNCGDWHAHPAPHTLEPSQGDREAWANCLRQSEHDAWVGLIVADDPSGLPSAARWGAWVTTRYGTRPATLMFT
jgi:hypothetical protein